jgi:cytochrome c-type biogenesis protein CcmH/NrfF
MDVRELRSMIREAVDNSKAAKHVADMALERSGEAKKEVGEMNHSFTMIVESQKSQFCRVETAQEKLSGQVESFAQSLKSVSEVVSTLSKQENDRQVSQNAIKNLLVTLVWLIPLFGIIIGALVYYVKKEAAPVVPSVQTPQVIYVMPSAQPTRGQ